MDLEQIKKRIQLIEKYKKEIKTAKELLKSELDNDSNYQTALEKANEAGTDKKRIKNEIMGLPQNEKILWEIKENQEEITILEEALSQELVDFYSKEKKDEIQDSNGQMRKFKIVVKLMPVKNDYL